jgi:hypothetical protein
MGGVEKSSLLKKPLAYFQILSKSNDSKHYSQTGSPVAEVFRCLKEEMLRNSRVCTTV